MQICRKNLVFGRGKVENRWSAFISRQVIRLKQTEGSKQNGLARVPKKVSMTLGASFREIASRGTTLPTNRRNRLCCHPPISLLFASFRFFLFFPSFFFLAEFHHFSRTGRENTISCFDFHQPVCNSCELFLKWIRGESCLWNMLGLRILKFFGEKKGIEISSDK